MSKPLDPRLADALFLAIKQKYPDCSGYRRQSIRELMASEFAKNGWDKDRLEIDAESTKDIAKALSENYFIWESTDNLIDLADSCTDIHDGKDKSLDKRWETPAAYVIAAGRYEDETVNMENLSNCAEEYLYSGLESRTFELWIARHLIFSEAHACALQLGEKTKLAKSNRRWYGVWSCIQWIIGAGSALAIGSQYGAGVGWVAFVVWLACIRYLSRDRVDATMQVARTLTTLTQAYKVATRSLSCPREVARALKAAERQLAVWPAGLWPLVEHAIARDGVTWRALR